MNSRSLGGELQAENYLTRFKPFWASLYQDWAPLRLNPMRLGAFNRIIPNALLLVSSNAFIPFCTSVARPLVRDPLS